MVDLDGHVDELPFRLGPLCECVRGDDVASPLRKQQDVGGERRFGRRRRFERIDVGPHESCGIFGLLRRRRHHQGNRLAGETNAVAGEDGSLHPGDLAAPLDVGEIEVGGGEHGRDAWCGGRFRRVDRPEQSVGDGTPHEPAVENLPTGEIGYVAPFACDQTIDGVHGR
jgi:hypothetical protein